MLTEIKAIWHHLNPIFPQQQVLDTPNTPEKQDLDLKSQHIMLIEGFKKDINNSFKEIQEKTVKQGEALKEV